MPGDSGRCYRDPTAGYRLRRGLLQRSEEVASKLNANASANQFEQVLADLGELIGLSTERYDDVGEGPYASWLLPPNTALIGSQEPQAGQERIDQSLDTAYPGVPVLTGGACRLQFGVWLVLKSLARKIGVPDFKARFRHRIGTARKSA